MIKKIMAIWLAVLVIAAGIGYFVWESQSYVAKVGNWKIKNHEYIFFLRAQKKATETEAGVDDENEIAKLWETPVDGEDPRIIVINKALENAKEFKVQLIKAEQSKFKLSDQERREIIRNLDSLLNNRDNVNYVKKELGLTLSQFRDVMIKSGLVSRYAYDFMNKNRDAVAVSDDELKAYYVDNRESIDEVTIICLFMEAVTNEQKQEKKHLAEDLLKRIQQGEDMTVIVEQYGDEASKEDGGLDTFTLSEAIKKGYEKELTDWVFSAGIGSVHIIETGTGFYIVKIEDKKTFEDKRELIKSAIKAQKLNEYYYSQVQDWINSPELSLIKNENVLSRITQRVFYQK
jgi:foldase protein PrsA